MNQAISPKVRFTWDISYDCNYRCSYCFFEGKWEEYKSRTVYLSADEWAKYWRTIYEKHGHVFLIITGGEPFIYPGFKEIIKKVSELCYHINISTNSSGDLDSFVKEANPGKVSLSLSFQREFDNLDNFINKVKLIRKHGFDGCLNLVAYPPFLELLESDKRRLKEETGEDFKVIAFFGKYQNVDYPDGYTKKEREKLGFGESWFSKIKRENMLCNAGHTSALLFPNGQVARCGQIGEKLILGNFFEPNFKLCNEPLPCDASYCPCEEYVICGKEDAEKDTGTPISSGLSDICRHNLQELLETNRSLCRADTKVNFTWDIHYKCNFRCPYCWFFTNWAQQKRRNLYLDPKEWRECWERIFQKYGQARIAITGGEPFIYPHFIELVKEISSLHIVKITTNMSGDIEKFVREISPARVYLDLNFHPVFSKDLNEFIRKVKLLHSSGFDAGVCFLAYPPQISMLHFYKRRFEESGIRFAVAAFWGRYQNKQYPADYTDEEKKVLKEHIGGIDRIEYHLNSTSPKGRICNAGYRYGNINGDGTVLRCAQYRDQPIGNIIDRNFSLFNTPGRCEKDKCPGNEYENICGD